MNYPIPTSPQELIALRQQQVDEELVASAIAGVIKISRLEGKSLAELRAEVMADDSLLDAELRYWLSEIVAQAWDSFG